MKVDFRRSFTKDLKKINNVKLLGKIQEVIEQIELAVSLTEINNLKKLQAEGNYFRVRVGNYRIGIRLVENTIIFVRVLPRKDIYRYFP